MASRPVATAPHELTPGPFLGVAGATRLCSSIAARGRRWTACPKHLLELERKALVRIGRVIHQSGLFSGA